MGKTNVNERSSHSGEPLMDDETRRIVEGIVKLAKRQNLDPQIALLTNAIVHLYKQTGQLRQTDLDAFEQIEELDRRQGPGDQ